WGHLDQLGRRMRNAGLQGRAHIVSDDNVFPLYGERVSGVLREAGFAVESVAVPHGEQSKSFDTAVRLYDTLVERRAERGDCIVALGGGVVGDLAGHIAATFLRGMPFVQVPTSVIGMVDSAIGGKVGINHPSGKNLIGAFYQPRLVLADVETLTTLPRREQVSGWAEVAKHALIRDPDLLELLEKRARQLTELYPEVVTDIVARSAEIKAKIVSEDEKERGIRVILNYGHTIGHGLETATDYERFLHGEAVAIGMMGAAAISRRMGLLSQEDAERQQTLLAALGLPIRSSDVAVENVLQAVELDKKVRGRKVRWVLLSGIGQVEVRDDVPYEVVETAIRELLRS
ncbi:MAG: 3-dehydroquinate synthase, partial [Dehalococcoidia bacterium]